MSFFSGFGELLPEPVVLALELIALAWCRCLWLTMCFFERLLIARVVSSFDTLVAGFELLPE